MLAMAGCSTTPEKTESRTVPRRSETNNVIAEHAFVLGVNIGIELGKESRTNKDINYAVRAYELKNQLMKTDTNTMFDALDFKTNSWTF